MWRQQRAIWQRDPGAHHRLVHRHHWTVRIIDGGPVWFLPDGTRWEAGRTMPVRCGDIVALRRVDGGAGLAEHWDGTPPHHLRRRNAHLA